MSLASMISAPSGEPDDDQYLGRSSRNAVPPSRNASTGRFRPLPPVERFHGVGPATAARIASTKFGPIAGVMTKRPSALQWSEANLARNLLYETPADAVSWVSARIFALICSAISVADAMSCRFSVISR